MCGTNPADRSGRLSLILRTGVKCSETSPAAGTAGNSTDLSVHSSRSAFSCRPCLRPGRTSHGDKSRWVRPILMVCRYQPQEVETKRPGRASDSRGHARRPEVDLRAPALLACVYDADLTLIAPDASEMGRSLDHDASLTLSAHAPNSHAEKFDITYFSDSAANAAWVSKGQ